MGGIVKIVKGVLNKALDVVADIVKKVWDAVVEPIMEEVVGLFGITDELVVLVSKVSTKVYGVNIRKPSKNAITKAVLGKAQDLNYDHSYFDHYWYQINSTKVSLTTFYRYGLTQFEGGVPDAVIHGTSIDATAVDNAVSAALGPDNHVKSFTSGYPTERQHFQTELQESPYFYRPAVDKLTYTDSNNSTVYDDWAIKEIFYNGTNSNYEITLTRQAAIAEFWITGDIDVVEGKSVTYTIHSTIQVPAGDPLPIEILYGGSAPGVDYNEVISVNMLEGENSASFTVSTNDNSDVDGSREFTVTIGVIDNSGGIFQAVGTIAPFSITTLIHDEDSPALFVENAIVEESLTEVTLGVKIINSADVGFTVDYTTVGGTALAGADYTTTAGTLTFVGGLGEVQSITIPITNDITDDSGETFTVVLSNCSEPSIDINSVGTVTIIDSSAGNPSTATSTVSEILVQPDFVRKSSLIVKYFHNPTDPLALDWHYWIYELALNTYAGLDPISDTSTNFELFPLAILRKNQVSLQNYASASLIASTRMLLGKLNLNLDEIIASIETSPDLADIKDAYINVGINPIDGGREISKLLWYLFYPILVESPVSSNQGKYFITIEQGDIHNATVWHEQYFNPAINGVIGSVGDFSHVVSATSLAVRKQINISQYDEMLLLNLNSVATIDYNDHHEMAANVLGDVDFTLPVSWYTLNQLSPQEQMDVFDKIIRLDFYAVKEEKIAWYKTAAFMQLFQVVLVIVTIASGGLSAPATTGAATAAQAGATSSILAMAQQIAINYAIAAVVSQVAKLTGNDVLAAIIGVVAAISLAPTGPGLGGLSEMVDAKTLLKLSVDFAENLIDAYSVTAQQEAKELGEEITEFNEKAGERLEELSTAGYTPAVDAEFLAMLRSVDTQSIPAISGIYEFNTLYDYDSIVGNYNENLLRIGVV